MQKNIGMALGLALLLSACSSSLTPSKTATSTSPTTTTTPTTATTATTDSSAEIPAVPRNVNMGNYVCPATGSAPLSQRLTRGADTLDQGTRVSGLFKPMTDLPDTLQDMLYTPKSIINNMYYGYSTVDLNALHESTYQAFKKEFPNKLNSYILSDNFFSYSNLTAAQQNKVDDLMSTYIDGVKDGHTYYMNQAQTIADKQGSSPAPVLGVNLATVPSQDGLILTSVRLDGPAWAAGLRRGDVILSINGVALSRGASTDDDAAYTNMRKVLTDAINKGGALSLVIKTAGQQRTVSVTPAILKGTSMPWGEVRTDAAGKQHYYLRIPTFSSVGPERNKDVPMPIASKVNQLVAEAQSKGIDNIVVDLRGNGGGLLIEFVGAAAAFTPQMAGESTRYIDGSTLNFGYSNGKVTISDPCGYSGSYAVQNVTQWKGKVVVLVDGDSASASEMFSTNLREAGFKIIGAKTYGVGSTSTYHLDLPAGRSMSITAGRTLIAGKPVDEYITPDIVSKDDLTKLADTGIDNTLQAAYDALK